MYRPIHINNSTEVVQLVEACKVQGLPDVTLHGLSVTHEAVGPVAGLVKELAAVGHTGGHTQSLAQGASGHVDKVESGRGMALEVGVNLTEVHELGGWEEAGLGPRGVKDGSGVPLGQNESEKIGNQRFIQKKGCELSLLILSPFYSHSTQ